MRRGTRFEIGLISLLLFIFWSSPFMSAESGFHTALAAAEQSVEPEGAPNGLKVYDPNEQLNRKIFEFNDQLYFYVFKPVGKAWSAVVPAFVRGAIRSGFHNLIFPSRFINFVLQGKIDKAANETARFVINSTIGFAGLRDIAQSDFKLPGYESDFGQTLALWGVGSGAYLVIPVLGPSNPRDLVGFAADSAMDPLNWIPTVWWVTFTAQTGKFVNYTSLHIGEYEELKKASVDPYIAMRDGYVQYREHMISK
jgi:phospholipid-binding lipoprotein MlaA